MAKKSNRRAPWPDDRLEQELRALHQDEKYFLTGKELRQRGKSGLVKEIGRYGARYWAWRIDRPTRPGPQGPRLSWQQAELQANRLIAEEGRLPGVAQLRAGRHHQLAQFIEREAGTREELLEGLGYSVQDIEWLTRRPEVHPVGRWQDADIRSMLERFCEGRDWFPVARDFREAELYNLYFAVRRHGGLDYWAAEMKLPRTASSHRISRRGKPGT